MTRAQLEHAIRAACDVADDTDLIIFGSQAILGEHPGAAKVGWEPHPLRRDQTLHVQLVVGTAALFGPQCVMQSRPPG